MKTVEFLKHRVKFIVRNIVSIFSKPEFFCFRLLKNIKKQITHP